MGKIECENKEKTHPLYKYLKSHTPGGAAGLLGQGLKWNFAKFLCNAEGTNCVIPLKLVFYPFYNFFPYYLIYGVFYPFPSLLFIPLPLIFPFIPPIPLIYPFYLSHIVYFIPLIPLIYPFPSYPPLGKPISRYLPVTSPLSIEKDILKLLDL
ncbi:hypothetical protein B484DRAFT_190326 [Ochromonadaceae sp. CCMP2298]|nr:hypothetical protein B484DRAFT_190326 [Ochromonadaceae sp. CCMP2298]